MNKRCFNVAGPALALTFALHLAACAPTYREDYESDARGQAADACHAAGISANDKGYYDCFQAHLNTAMAAAPVTRRPVPEHQPTDWEVCDSYGFKFGTDAFAQCLQRRDEERRQVGLELLRATVPVAAPSISCSSYRIGRFTTTQCN